MAGNVVSNNSATNHFVKIWKLSMSFGIVVMVMEGVFPTTQYSLPRPCGELSWSSWNQKHFIIQISYTTAKKIIIQEIKNNIDLFMYSHISTINNL